MANEVNINITANNLTGPGFASATGNAIAFAVAINNVTNKIGGASAAAKDLNKSVDDTGKMIIQGSRAGGVFGGVVQGLTSHIKLFGGALDQIGLPKIIAMVSGWHLLTEAAIEMAAVWVPAGIAMAAFAAAAAPTVKDLTQRMQSLNTASQALHQSVYPLTGTFRQVSDAVKPEVYQLFGEALIVASRNSGTFQTMATGVGKVLDDLGARFVVATSNMGKGGFAKHAVEDFRLLGDSIGNLGAILGVVFKAVPGYAEILLRLGDGALHLVAVFASAAEPILKWGLAAHGALIYAGLLGTGIAKLASSGFAALESLALRAAVGMVGMGKAGAVAGEAMGKFSGIMGTAAGLPWGWIAIAAGALVGLGIALASIKNPAEQFNQSMQDLLNNSKITDLATNLANAIAQTQHNLTQSSGAVTAALRDQVPAIQGVAGHFEQNYNPALDRAASIQTSYGQGVRQLTQEQQLYTSRLAEVSKQYGSNKAALAELNAAGITSAQMLDKNKAKWQEVLVELKATDDAMKAVTQNSGRLGAAENALNFDAGDTANTLGQLDQTIKKLTTAQQNLMSVLTSGEGDWATYELNLNTMAKDMGIVQTSTSKLTNSVTNAAKVTSGQGVSSTISLRDHLGKTNSTTVTLTNSMNQYTKAMQSVSDKTKLTTTTTLKAKASLSDLTTAGIKVSSDFYNVVVPSAQKFIGALEMQDISTANLTTAIATMDKQMLSMVGNNKAARAVIIAMTNDALGPNTVSFKNLDSWVGKNSTTMKGFKNIVDSSTVSASKMAGVLQDDLNAMFVKDLIDVSGASGALKTYTKDITDNTAATAKGKSDRQTLINDLVSSGMNAKEAARFVDGLSSSVGKLKSKNINITMDGKGQFSLSEINANTGKQQQAAAGLYVTGGIPGKDSVLVKAMPGEVIVPTHMVQRGEVDHLRGKIPGFASGGVVPGGNLTPAYIAGTEVKFQSTMTAAMVAAMRTALKAAEAAAQAAAASSGGGSAGPGGGSAGQNQALAKQLMPSWSTGSMWSAWQNLWNRESGWSQFADTRKSGLDPPNASVFAYGIPQSRPYSKMPKAGWPADHGGSSNPHAQETWGIGYIESTYHNPANAWSHEVSQGWYDNGGWLKPGLNMAYNGTGKPERVMGPDDWGGMIQLEVTSGGQSSFEQFMLKMIREFVRVKGGGDVRKAFEGKK